MTPPFEATTRSFILSEDEVAILMDLLHHELKACDGRNPEDCPQSHIDDCAALLDKLSED